MAFLGVEGAGWQVGLATALGLCLGPIYPLTLACAAGLVPRLAGSISGLVIASSQVGGTLLPWLQGLLLAHGPSWGGGMTVLACAALAIAQMGFIRVHVGAGAL
jgi:fucose permease